MASRGKGDAYTVVYAVAICLVCSLMLAAAAAGLRPLQDRRVELDRKFNVLKAFQAQTLDAAGHRVGDAEIERLYADHVREILLDAETGRPIEGKTSADASPADLAERRVLPLFQWIEDGRVTKYAFPVSGKGLWSTIYGYVALDGQLRTIVGVTFYKHGETPGLGGEIEREWFQTQFRGREIVGNAGLKPIVIAKGSAGAAAAAADRVVVDGISGATMTGNGVMQFLNADFARYDAYFRTLRGG